MRLFIAVFLLASFSPVTGKEIPEWIRSRVSSEYAPVSKKTDAVLLYSDTRIEYRNGMATCQEKRLYKILKLDGLGYGTLHLDLNEDTRISGIEGFRFDSSGNLLEKLKSENIVRSAFNEHFFDDCKQLMASFETIETGDIVAFEYETREKLFFGQMFIPFGDIIEIARMQIETPPGALCAILNDPGRSVQTSGSTYSITGRPATKVEDGCPPLRERIPFVAIVFEPEPDRTWEAVSRKTWQRTQEIARLSEKTKADLQDLLAVRDRNEFIRQTLDHVSHSIRYVDIEVGDNRFIPRPVDLVHQKKYGDCKDMAYYAVAILREGGVNAHPVLALTDSYGPVFEEFPSDQFNHVVVAVELDSSSIELQNMEINGRPCLLADPTDRHTIPPKIGPELETTRILPVTETGSPLATVPSSPAASNHVKYDIDIVFSKDRNGSIQMLETAEGHYAANHRSFRESMEKAKENESYREYLHALVPGAEMHDFDVENEPASDTFRTRIHFSTRNLGTDAEDHIVFVPNIIDANRKGFQQRTRESDLVLAFLSSRTISVDLDVDPAYRIDGVPSDASVDNDFFSGSLVTRSNGNNLHLEVGIVWKVDRITVDRYAEFRKLYQDYLKLAKSPVTLVRQM